MAADGAVVFDVKMLFLKALGGAVQVGSIKTRVVSAYGFGA
jgi:hypothetical protein